MKRVLLPAVLLSVSTALAVVPAGPSAAQPLPVARVSFVVEPTTGHDLYTHTGPSDYRIGAALVSSSFTAVDQYNCGPRALTDPHPVIRLTHSSDGGTTWSPESLVLTGTPGERDAAGVCDPAVLELGGFTYLAYTGTDNGGTRQVFVARRQSATEPWVMWDGQGWSQDPFPVTAWTPSASGPSLVLFDGQVRLYYNVRLPDGTIQTRLAWSPGSAANWPSSMTREDEPVIEHPEVNPGLDCVGAAWPADTDVKYDITTNRFVAVTTDQAYPRSALQLYESGDDGLTFAKSTITRGDYHPGARSPAFLGTPTGAIPLKTPTAIVYSHTTACGSADVRWSNTRQLLRTTGSIVEPLTGSNTANWRRNSGQWLNQADGFRQDDRTAYAEASLAGRVASSSSTFSLHIDPYLPPGGYAGIHFGKANVDDTLDESGYVAYVESKDTDPKLCVVKAGFGTLGCTTIQTAYGMTPFNLRVVQSGGNIKAFIDGAPRLGVAVTDAEDPFLGGYVGLVTWQSAAVFSNLQIGDNVPGKSQLSDWGTREGAWAYGQAATTTFLSNGTSSGQLNLQTDQDLIAPVLTQLGDGTYSAMVEVGNGGPSPNPSAWAGIALADHTGSGSWSRGGYLVFLRANGHVGIYKAGSGQIVLDVATGTNPAAGPVRLRVLKTGANFQVYVGDRAAPYVNWTDLSSTAWAIGSFGVANLLAPATFSQVTYDGDAAR
ncbi:hypothetical protein ISU10_17865 [Nocardioides agariphilus]|uniref:BNR repeat-like domain-containing protein n=1 Tax=Nocardioides agariphilus TaxID=433664 RepID=A0A930VMS9_9ACTN|nr:hypothetical protein [Nocardioides agariphilus]MBF4769638.1 hypothetical protein [Nocardioides agariphilus]